MTRFYAWRMAASSGRRSSLSTHVETGTYPTFCASEPAFSAGFHVTDAEICCDRNRHVRIEFQQQGKGCAGTQPGARDQATH